MRGTALVIALLTLSLPALGQEAPAAQDAPALPGTPPVAAAVKKPAELRAEQLDILFAHLHQPGIESRPVEQRIWELWSASDSPTAEVLLQQSQRAMEDGAPAESLSILNRLIGAYPDFAEAWNKRATLYYLMKRDDDALKDLAHVLDLEPRHFGALAGKGMILERQKKYGEAREALNEALAVNPTLDEVKAALKELDRIDRGI